MAPVRSLCTGCQTFVARFFDPAPLLRDVSIVLHESFAELPAPLLRDAFVVLHESFAELSKCATEQCDLCRFIGREFYYYSSDHLNYSFTELCLRENSKVISIRPSRWGPSGLTERTWQFYHGEQLGSCSYYDSNKWLKNTLDARNAFGNHQDIDRLLLLSRQWLASCLSSHIKCNLGHQDGSSFLPTRLLDVGSPGQPFINLVLSEDLATSRRNEYMTLSYCWGPGNHSNSTTPDNYGSRMSKITIATLPKTFVDAIEITRALRVRYLWIDALCIMQPENGDKEDWEKEFPKMGMIYKHSICTIAASGAEHRDVGCFHRRDVARWPVSNYTLEDINRERGKDNPVRLEAKMPNWNVSVENSPSPNVAGFSKNGCWRRGPCSGPRTAFSGTALSSVLPSTSPIVKVYTTNDSRSW